MMSLSWDAEGWGEGPCWYFDVYAMFGYHYWGWKQRIKAVYYILFKAGHPDLWEIMLGPAQARRVAKFILDKVGESDEG